MRTEITPGVPWLDENGNRIQAHGACIYHENGTYYWIGEDKSHTSKKGKIWTWGVRMYSSQDLINWKDEGHIVSPKPDQKDSLFFPERRLDRPHLIRNHKTGKYVLWLKYCDRNHAAVLVSNTLKGPYAIVHDQLKPYGMDFGDFDLAVNENTMEAYLYFEADHDKLMACRLSDDYCDVDGEAVCIFRDQTPPFTREGVTHFTRNGKHYLLTSGMTGYVPNPSESAISDEFLGPYTVQGNPHFNDGSCASFNSQISDVFQVEGTDQLIAAADRWVPYYHVDRERYESLKRAISNHYDKTVKASLRDMKVMMTSPMMGSADTSVADYVWLPIEWNGDIPVIRWLNQWKPDKGV